MNELISVIVSTYNREDALDATLRALSRQSDRNFEIVVADDGSGPATAAVVQRWAAKAAVPVKHVWHEDVGFRLAEIRNRGILASGGRYLVFLDGDCLARRHFVAAHRRLAEPGWFVTGSRVLMSAELTARILGGRAGGGNLGARGVAAPARARRHQPVCGARGPAARRPAQDERAALARRARQQHGILAGRSRPRGWVRSRLQRLGPEDSDIFIRLIRAGIRRKDARHAGAVLHLWHREADRARLADNERQLDAVLQSGRITARQGLSGANGAQRIIA